MVRQVSAARRRAHERRAGIPGGRRRGRPHDPRARLVRPSARGAAGLAGGPARGARPRAELARVDDPRLGPGAALLLQRHLFPAARAAPPLGDGRALRPGLGRCLGPGQADHRRRHGRAQPPLPGPALDARHRPRRRRDVVELLLFPRARRGRRCRGPVHPHQRDHRAGAGRAASPGGGGRAAGRARPGAGRARQDGRGLRAPRPRPAHPRPERRRGADGAPPARRDRRPLPPRPLSRCRSGPGADPGPRRGRGRAGRAGAPLRLAGRAGELDRDARLSRPRRARRVLPGRDRPAGGPGALAPERGLPLGDAGGAAGGRDYGRCGWPDPARQRRQPRDLGRPAGDGELGGLRRLGRLLAGDRRAPAGRGLGHGPGAAARGDGAQRARRDRALRRRRPAPLPQQRRADPGRGRRHHRRGGGRARRDRARRGRAAPARERGARPRERGARPARLHRGRHHRHLALGPAHRPLHRGRGLRPQFRPRPGARPRRAEPGTGDRDGPSRRQAGPDRGDRGGGPARRSLRAPVPGAAGGRPLLLAGGEWPRRPRAGRDAAALSRRAHRRGGAPGRPGRARPRQSRSCVRSPTRWRAASPRARPN